MEYTVTIREPRGNIGYVTLGGRLGASAVDELRKVLLAEIEMDCYSGVVIDCRAVEYVSSAGLQVFMKAIQIQKKKKKPPLICRVSPGSHTLEIFCMVGLSDHMTIRTD